MKPLAIPIVGLAKPTWNEMIQLGVQKLKDISQARGIPFDELASEEHYDVLDDLIVEAVKATRRTILLSYEECVELDDILSVKALDALKDKERLIAHNEVWVEIRPLEKSGAFN